MVVNHFLNLNFPDPDQDIGHQRSIYAINDSGFRYYFNFIENNEYCKICKISLKTNMRVQLQHDESAEVFAKQLLDIGNGKMEMDASTHCITFPKNFCQIVEV